MSDFYRTRGFRGALFGCCACGALIGAPTAAHAQTEPAEPLAQSDTQIEDIVVTARRRAESLQDVPATVVAVTADQLAESGAQRLTDIQSVVPGLVFKNFGPGLSVISLRGSGNRLGAGSTVGVFQDGVNLGGSQLSKGAIDLERVEVAKGPQSTLYGRATMAGAINFVTKNPTNDFEGAAEIGIGGSSAGDEMLWHGRLILSGPLVSDTLLARLVISRDKRDGFLHDPVTDWRGMGYDRTFVRGKLLWSPTPDLDVSLTAEFTRDEPTLGAAYTYVDPPNTQIPFAPSSGPNAWDYTAKPLFFGKDFWDTRFTTKPYGKLRDNSYFLQVDWRTPIGTLTSTTAISKYSQDGQNDVDMSQYPVVEFQYPGNGKRFNQELRLAGGDRLRYLVGLYYLRTRGFIGQNIVFGPGASGYIAGLTAQYQPTDQTLHSYAGYFDLDYDISDQFSISGGLRFGRDKIEQTNQVVWTTRAGTVVNVFGPFTRDVDFNTYEGNVSASYKINPDALVYVRYGRGTRPGGLNNGNSVAIASLPYDPEYVDAFEIGAKATLFDGHLRTNAALFYNQYHDLQVGRNQAIGNPPAVFNTTANAAGARSFGLDLDGELVVADGLKLSFGYTYNDAKITDFVLSGATSAREDLSGLPILRSPKHSGNVALRYAHEFGDGSEFSLGSSFYFSSRYANDYIVPPTTGLPIQLFETKPYQTVGLTASYKTGPWELSGYVNNLFNEQYLASGSANFYNQLTFGIPGEPRTFEVTLKVNF